MTDNKRVAIVTGSSSGIGLDTSITLAQNGFLTYATMRNLDKGSIIETAAEKEKIPIRVVELDVTDDRSVSDAIQRIISEIGQIDVLANNAG